MEKRYVLLLLLAAGVVLGSLQCGVGGRHRMRPAPLEVVMNDGISYFYLQEYQVARSLWQACLDQDPGNSMVHNLLGIACSRLGQYQEAVRHFQAALGTQPGWAEVYNNLGYALVCLRQYTDAMACFKQALSIDDYYTHASGNLTTIRRILDGSLDQQAYHLFQTSDVLANSAGLSPGPGPLKPVNPITQE